MIGVDSAAALAVRAGLPLHWALIDAFAAALAGDRGVGRVSSQRLSAAFSVARQSAGLS